MALLLGIDTGGTYSDAVLYDPERGVVLRAGKALTTKHDLAEGIDGALAAVLDEAAPPIGFVALSTTLATNAIVEGHGAPAGLILIGQGPEALARGGLGAALGGDPVAFVAGGHDANGDAAAALDLAAAERAILAQRQRVTGFAVAGYFATRNPAHEIAVRERVRALTGLPVSCSHELSSELDAPRRAMTTLLNARLIPLLDRLVLAVERRLAARGITAPLMVVKGDGSLLSAESARLRPVETILSGPAASLVGAAHLSGERDACVADVGGTTTDVAFMVDGRPALNSLGARVGGLRTLVEAVDVQAVGLGGDSELGLAAAPGERAQLRLGPRRVVPLCLLATQWPEAVEHLRAQLARARAEPFDGGFALRLRAPEAADMQFSRGEQALWERLEAGPLSLAGFDSRYLDRRSLERLVARGYAVRAGFTPSDAAHLLGLQRQWSVEAAALGAALWRRRLVAAGLDDPGDEAGFCRGVFERMVGQSAACLLRAALASERPPAGEPDGPLARRAVEGEGADDLVAVRVSLRRPLVAVGASAAVYYPAVAERLHTRLAVPPHAGVCNAVGAVVGGILQRCRVLITQPSEGRFRVHRPDGVADFPALDLAAEAAGRAAREQAEALARRAGAGEIELQVDRDDRIVVGPDGSALFLESRVSALAVGRPRQART